MLNNAELLAKYREEKDLVCHGDPLDEDLFPSFKQWKATYVREYLETHQTVSVAKADQMMEAAQNEADVELARLKAELELEENEMTDETTNATDVVETTETTEVTEAPVAAATAPETVVETPAETTEETTETPKAVKPKRKSTTKKAATKKTATKKAATPKKAAKPVTKMDKARKIFTKYFGKETRAQIIVRLQNEAGCTANGAATYYQKLKGEAEA